MQSKPHLTTNEILSITKENVHILDKYSVNFYIWDTLIRKKRTDIISTIIDYGILPDRNTSGIISLFVHAQNTKIFKLLAPVVTISTNELYEVFYTIIKKSNMEMLLDIHKYFGSTIKQYLSDDKLNVLIKYILRDGTLEQFKTFEIYDLDMNIEETGDYLYLYNAGHNPEFFKYILDSEKLDGTLFDMGRLVHFFQQRGQDHEEVIVVLLNHRKYNGGTTYMFNYGIHSLIDKSINRIQCELLKFKERRGKILVSATNLYSGPVSIVNDYF